MADSPLRAVWRPVLVRFKADLERKGTLEGYMELLVSRFPWAPALLARGPTGEAISSTCSRGFHLAHQSGCRCVGGSRVAGPAVDLALASIAYARVLEITPLCSRGASTGLDL